ncbi:hypothetical protein M9434_000028 [Picochlorum sp. BPE23]|nr:hypothetical protein M9434_000028 [Picochlorum sp. BPE23]
MAPPAHLEVENQTKSMYMSQVKNNVAFWLLGLLNNASYVIMIAGAVKISASAVGLVYLCAVLPGIICKASAPYWFHKVSYSRRMVLAAFLMVMAFLFVGLGETRGVQLIGVVCAALQSSIGEASCLALTSHFHSQTSITMWSSGTGFAGVFGYAWVAFLHVIGGLSFRFTLLSALVLPLIWVYVFFQLLESPDGRTHMIEELFTGNSILVMDALGAEESEPLARTNDTERNSRKLSAVARMTFKEKFMFVLGLWSYTVPLFLVYFAEYAMQSGVWTSIGFPVDDEEARHRFYVYANWMYQGGVFVSRSSGTVWQAEKPMLWAMPGIQVVLLLFFGCVAVYHVLYNWGLLLPCFCTGLLGGAVYVNAFTLISRDVPVEYKEFSLAAASVSDSIGVAAADVAGILLQGCLFKLNGLQGADFKC